MERARPIGEERHQLRDAAGLRRGRAHAGSLPEMSAQDLVERMQATAPAPAEGWSPFIGYGAVSRSRR